MFAVCASASLASCAEAEFHIGRILPVVLSSSKLWLSCVEFWPHEATVSGPGLEGLGSKVTQFRVTLPFSSETGT